MFEKQLIRKLIKISWIAFFISSCYPFETNQLPLSDTVSHTFPNLHTTCFIIVNLDTNIVVHERNSNKKIDIGTFEKVIAGQVIRENSGAKFSTLRDMSFAFSQCDIFHITHKLAGLNICFFNSGMSGVGCAFMYQNPRGARFVCVMYGEESIENTTTDSKKISDWLDQFYGCKISENTEDGIQIPVIYGTARSVQFDVPSTCNLLLAKICSRKINWIIRYRTIVKAPIKVGDALGFVFYQTDLFKNPIVKVIRSNKKIAKTNWIRCIRDSIMYLIFGPTMYSKEE